MPVELTTPARGVTPRDAVLNFFGAHVVGEPSAPSAVPARVLIEVCGDLGIAEHAARSTVKRLVHSDLLQRERVGRTASYSATSRAHAVLRDGARRIRDSLEPSSATGESWTLVAFSLPDAHQRLRHSIRSRLQWAGFGPLQSGLWIAPGEADLSVLDDLNAGEYVQTFTAAPHSIGSIVDVAESVWDLSELGHAYRDFTSAWSRSAADVDNALATELSVTSEWLAIIARDPRLPQNILPAAWPVRSAAAVFSSVLDSVRPAATRRVRSLLEQYG